MLALSRKPGQAIRIAGGIEVTVVSVHGNRVILGFQAPPDCSILRSELPDRPFLPVSDSPAESDSHSKCEPAAA